MTRPVSGPVPATAVMWSIASSSRRSSSWLSLIAAGTWPSGSMWSLLSPTGGIVVNVSMSGPRSRSGCTSALPASSSPAYATSTVTNDLPRRNSGISSIGGTLRMRPIDVASSGAVRVKSRHALRTSAARSTPKKNVPA